VASCEGGQARCSPSQRHRILKPTVELRTLKIAEVEVRAAGLKVCIHRLAITSRFLGSGKPRAMRPNVIEEVRQVRVHASAGNSSSMSSWSPSKDQFSGYSMDAIVRLQWHPIL
jgi:hypothetical protein